MEVTERRVISRGKQVGRQGVLVAAKHPPLRQLRELARRQIGVAHGDQWQILPAASAPFGQHLGIDLSNPFDQPVLSFFQRLYPQIAAAQERHGGAPGGDLALPVLQRYQQTVGLELALTVAADTAHQMQIKGAQQLVGGIELGGGVVVAADQHHVEAGHFGAQSGQKAVELLPGAGGGICGIKQITRHQQGVDLARLEGVAQPVEEGIVFKTAVMTMELMAKVPVGGMEDFHWKAARLQGRCLWHPMKTR